MILRHLELVNFRQYSNTVLDIHDGVTSIVGPNGSGKSTILEAISWCLYGAKMARTTKEGIKRQGALPGDDCSVRLTFELAGRQYVLERALLGKTGKSEARLLEREGLDTVSTREVDRYIIHLIGLDHKGFLSSFFARQKELNALTDARPAARKDHLAKMLGVGRLDNAIVLLKDDIKEVRQEIDILSGLQIDPSVVAGRIDELSTDRKELNRTLENLRKVSAERQAETAALAEQVRIGRERERHYNKLNAERTGAVAQHSERTAEAARLTAELAELEQVEKKIGPLEAAAASLTATEAEFEQLKEARAQSQERSRLEREKQQLQASDQKEEAELQGLNTEITGLEQDMATPDTLRSAIEAAEKRREEMAADYGNLRAELQTLQSDLSRLEKQKADIEELGPEAVCEFCLRPFGTELPDIERHFDLEITSIRQKMIPVQKKFESVTTDGKANSKKLEELKKQLEKATGVERQLTELKTTIRGIERSRRQQRERMAEISARLNEIGAIVFDADRFAHLEQTLRGLRKQHEELLILKDRIGRRGEITARLDEVTKKVADLDDEIASIRAEIMQLKFDEKAVRQLEEELEKRREDVAALRLEFERMEHRISLVDSETEQLRNKLDEFEKSKQRISDLRDRLTYLEKLSILFADFRVYLIGRIRPALSKRTSELFYTMTAGRYQEVVLDEEYNLKLYDSGEAFPIERFSGGEIDLANLCFRLAISLEMAASAGIDHSFIILDEIFGSQDRERQKLIMHGLAGLKNWFRQIVIVSHIEEVKEMAEHLMTVRRGADGISTALYENGEL